MALDSYKPLAATDNKASWPLAKFYFSVDLGSGMEMGFQGVEGLSSSVEPYEFRDGSSTAFHKEKRPGLVSYDPITLKKGMFVSDVSMYKWYDTIRGGSWDMRTVTIKLKDEQGSDVFTWTLKNAFPTKFTPTTMDAESDTEIAIEELELTCQSWEMSGGGGSMFSAVSGFLKGAATSVAAAASASLTASIASRIF
jgi:phage tail-like protein